MLKEGALAVFKMSIKYEGPSCEEVVEFRAQNTSEAKLECDRIFSEACEARISMEKRNVYCSKRVVSCILLDRDWRDVLMCLPKLEDNI